MNIIKTSHPDDKRIQYRLTRSRARAGMKSAPERLTVAAYVLYEDVNNATGEMVTLLAITDNDGAIYCTNSPTFVEDFAAIVEAFPDVDEIQVLKQKSKKGREFISCTIDF